MTAMTKSLNKIEYYINNMTPEQLKDFNVSVMTTAMKKMNLTVEHLAVFDPNMLADAAILAAANGDPNYEFKSTLKNTTESFSPPSPTTFIDLSPQMVFPSEEPEVLTEFDITDIQSVSTFTQSPSSPPQLDDEFVKGIEAMELVDNSITCNHKADMDNTPSFSQLAVTEEDLDNFAKLNVEEIAQICTDIMEDPEDSEDSNTLPQQIATINLMEDIQEIMGFNKTDLDAVFQHLDEPVASPSPNNQHSQTTFTAVTQTTFTAVSNTTHSIIPYNNNQVEVTALSLSPSTTGIMPRTTRTASFADLPASSIVNYYETRKKTFVPFIINNATDAQNEHLPHNHRTSTCTQYRMMRGTEAFVERMNFNGIPISRKDKEFVRYIFMDLYLNERNADANDATNATSTFLHDVAPCIRKFRVEASAPTPLPCSCLQNAHKFNSGEDIAAIISEIFVVCTAFFQKKEIICRVLDEERRNQQ